MGSKPIPGMSKFYEEDNFTADEARFAAQRIAFGPLVFHAALALRDLGILSELMRAGPAGSDRETLAETLSLSRYAVTVLLESGLGAQLVYLKNDRYHLSKTGYFMLHDEMTRVNMNFVRDVCYSGAANLVASLKEQRPAGLATLADSAVIYEGLASLPEPAKTSWFEFDHYYSDSAFRAALPYVFRNSPTTLMDVGCNTGKFAGHCAEYSADVALTLVDSPSMVRLALENFAALGFEGRATGAGINLLNHTAPLPAQHNAIWMSQLLSCFSEQDVTEILRRGAAALAPGGELFILETFWDQQAHAGGAFSLLQTSLYFTTMANGSSRVYDLNTLEECIFRAGMRVVERHAGLGLSHMLLRCAPTNPTSSGSTSSTEAR